MYKLLLVDCMGTLTTTRSGQPLPQHPEDLQPLPGAADAIAYFYRNGWKIIALANEDRLNCPEGSIPLETAKGEKVHTLRLFPGISKVYFSDRTGDYCWSVELDFSVENKMQVIETEYRRSDFVDLSRPDRSPFDSFRKPGSGMFRLALLELPDDPEEVWAISSYGIDREAAIAAKVNFCPTGTWLQRYPEF